MPKFRSITLSVISQWEKRIHPEYPHPLSQRFRVSNSMQKLDSEVDDDDETVQEYSYVSGAGDGTNVSVYIPSCPATRFWIRYAISPDHSPTKFFYFKLYLNGRHITSWGTNPKKNPKGQVMRALFNPEFDENMCYKPIGIQTRPFFFAPQKAYGSSALDGGLIEVRCYRAKGRRRIAPVPEDFRGGQEGYGLNLPKGDLLDYPQDAKFYDWLLVDPKDSPHARFKFHYRTWDSLQALSLIPMEVPKPLARTSSMWSITKAEEDKLGRVEDSFQQSAETGGLGKRSHAETILNGLGVPHQEVYQQRPLPIPGSSSGDKISNSREANRMENYNGHQVCGSDGFSQEKSVSDRPPTPFSGFFNLPQKIATPERPLPTPPKRKLQRTSSTVSLAASVTPSLCSYVDRESSDSPEPYLGVAAVVPFSTYGDGDETSTFLEGCSQFTVIPPPRDESPNRFLAQRARLGIERPPEAMFSPASVAALREIRDRDRNASIRPSRAAPVRDYYSDRFRYENYRREPSEFLGLPTTIRSVSPRRSISPSRSEAQTEYMSALEEQDEDTITKLRQDDSFLRTPSPTKEAHEHVIVEDGEGDSMVYHEALEYGKSEENISHSAAASTRVHSRVRIRTWI